MQVLVGPTSTAVRYQTGLHELITDVLFIQQLH